ncbi:MAG: ABC transporter permease [Clostridia bacterium]|nr:ABC transporter permease [Clostridia bacterium]
MNNNGTTINKNAQQIHEPLFQVTKRAYTTWQKAWIIRAVAIAVALVICAVVIVLVTGLNPLNVYGTMFEGNFGTERKIWNLLREIAMLLCVSLAVTPAFKMKFWNIGAEGQSLIGALASVACMIYLGDKLPNGVLIPVMLISSVLAGALWGLIPAYFKAKFNTNETLFTLMMNYIAMQLVAFCIVFWENPKNSNNVGVINSSSKSGWLPVIGDQKYLLPVLIVALLTAVMFIYLRYSKQGYEISVVGESQNTAKYVGINVKKVVLRTMAISGAICGIAGFLITSGVDHSIRSDTIGGLGFTAIMVSWLAKFNPIYMVLSSFLIVFLEIGASSIATDFKLNESIADVLTGIILFFIIGSEFFIQYKLKFHKRDKKEA